MPALFRKQHPELWEKSQFFTKLWEKSQFFTQWVPMPGDMSRKVVQAAIDERLEKMGTERLDLLQIHWDERLKKMGTERLDLLQFHWWDYGSKGQYLEALGHMQDMATEGKNQYYQGYQEPILGQYLEALGHMQDMVTEGKIRHLALTNFDTGA
ncbi:hypothetical protein T484DRAFT_1785141 [Baffinella frigidus]|nr:hypothetical protein T484DRAFT_1785141 [Cryptophyta sp. CCMP2293]